MPDIIDMISDFFDEAKSEAEFSAQVIRLVGTLAAGKGRLDIASKLAAYNVGLMTTFEAITQLNSLPEDVSRDKFAHTCLALMASLSDSYGLHYVTNKLTVAKQDIIDRAKPGSFKSKSSYMVTMKEAAYIGFQIMTRCEPVLAKGEAYKTLVKIVTKAGYRTPKNGGAEVKMSPDTMRDWVHEIENQEGLKPQELELRREALGQIYGQLVSYVTGANLTQASISEVLRLQPEMQTEIREKIFPLILDFVSKHYMRAWRIETGQ